MASTTDRAQRSRAILDEARLLARAAPAVPLFFSEGAFAFRGQIYDGWVFIRGSGILDKRAFLPGEAAAREAPPAGAGAGDDGGDVGAAAADESGSTLDIVSIISLLALGVVVVLAALALRQRRRTR